MPDFLRKTGWVLGVFLVFDVVGVLLTLVVDALAAWHRVWEGSAPLGYVIWFVVGVFCALAIYGPTISGEPDSAAGRRAGSRLVAITAAVAALLGLVSSLFWSGHEWTEPVAPDHRGVTLTFLATVVLAVAAARYVLFREGAAPVQGRPAPDPPATRPGEERAKIAAALREQAARVEAATDDPAAFRPAGFWKTLAFLLGVPVLLFLDVSFFLLGPFDLFDRWTDALLTTAVLGGLAWGFAAARWRHARTGLLALHAPLIVGTVFYFFALFLAGVLVVFGVPEQAGGIVASIGFWLGFLLGGGAIVGWGAELFEKGATPGREKV